MPSLEDLIVNCSSVYGRKISPERVDFYERRLSALGASEKALIDGFASCMEAFANFPTVANLKQHILEAKAKNPVRRYARECVTCKNEGSLRAEKGIHWVAYRCDCEAGQERMRYPTKEQVESCGYAPVHTTPAVASKEMTLLMRDLLDKVMTKKVNSFELAEQMYELDKRWPNAGFRRIAERIIGDWERRTSRESQRTRSNHQDNSV